ncbi:protein ASPARTIC PROTEASE IN GUARD CELL 2-like [Panicum miliaceum]|uniref:Protein ASPARTIC PROTEASE IN GUARD CELL 2-like n=1 Tax=Panicum miliaceum TaxID=4540 RepID=A0A3L6SQ02_PANMI|nr:protein ASPARTIC PROTEASE IN GUARD CELL 2-like [Panicum miliaceum]
MAPLPALLLLLLATSSNAAALAKPVEYHSFAATPLSPHPYTAPAPGADEDVFGGSLAAAEEAPAVRFRVVHRDAFAVNATAAELLRHRLRRDRRRAARISQAAAGGAAANGTRGAAGGGGVAAPVVSGIAQGSGEYFTKIGVGTPATPALMVLDTGSDVVWLQCAPCRRCYDQSGPVFDPRRSSSYGAVDCAAPLCRRLDSGGCDLRRRACLYQVAYGDGSVTAGDFATETLTFAGGARVARVALGCGHDNEGLFVAAAGLLGLGRGSLSFPTQISRRYGRSFSYCLVDRTSSSGGGPGSSRSSTVTFGPAAVAPSASASFTPMVRNPRMETFYYVQLVGISVGGARVPGVAESDLRLDPSTGRGGVIVDSGTSVTRLARPAYSALRDAFRGAAAGLRLSPGGFSLFDTCYDLGGRKVVKVPTVSMHFAGGAEAALPPENYLIPVDSRGTFCFAFAGTDGGVSIIGNIQQQGFRVVFDGDGQRVGFAPKGC